MAPRTVLGVPAEHHCFTDEELNFIVNYDIKYRVGRRSGEEEKRVTAKLLYNIYCDESCHLESTDAYGMVIGAIWCPINSSRAIADEVRELKTKHGMGVRREIKWTGLSSAKLHFYLEVLDYFFKRDDLNFRAIVIPDKGILDHKAFNQEHGTWYYKMFYDLLKMLFVPNSSYRIFLDVKDTHSGYRAEQLRGILERRANQMENCVIELIQNVRSHEVQQIQLVDLLIGAISYASRGLKSSDAKLEFVTRFERLVGGSIINTTPASRTKVNILRWDPDRGRQS